MTIKALFLDFYGTVVHEDDDIIPIICKDIIEATEVKCDVSEVSRYWWNTFSRMFHSSYGENFVTQRQLGLKSLEETISHFKSSQHAEDIIQKQFIHWQRPEIFEDSIPFLTSCELPIYIVSNIDTDDILKAINYHDIRIDGVITSEDVRSYKPRPEIFLEALRKFNVLSSEVMHVGDSLVSDIQGAQAVGIQTTWINRRSKLIPEHINPNYIIKDLSELMEILGKSQ
jgi:2-haloalkanoic acid dehalogenase type II